MITKKKVCKTCDTEQYIWKNGNCKTCSSKLNTAKVIKKSYSPIKKYSTKGLEKKKEKAEYTEKQFELFKKHWDLKPHYCESCNKWLGTENNLCFHDHLIEKSKRKDIALDINNLFLVCFDCHSLKTNGFPTEKHKIAIEKAKIKFNN